jgi:integrase
MEKRKDSKGRNLRVNESQLKSGLYRYRYTDEAGKRHAIYSWRLTPADKTPAGKRPSPDLRAMEAQLMEDSLSGLDRRLAENTTLNELFERYMQTKQGLKFSTRNDYLYKYEHYVRGELGGKPLEAIRYSDMKMFYLRLHEAGLKPATVESVHTLLHPVFQMGVRDGMLRANPTEGLMAELRSDFRWRRAKRHALTIPEQTCFMRFIHESPMYAHWEPFFTFLLGTGCRVGEAAALRWEDVDLEQNKISIRHTLIYRPNYETGRLEKHLSSPKTPSSRRTIPLFSAVREALFLEKQEQLARGVCLNEMIDGFAGFVFLNRRGGVFTPGTVNYAIERIRRGANLEEERRARMEGREPVVIRKFSAHNLRHTFATRLCEKENNLKLISEIMGHSDIETTMNLYTEVTEERKQQAFGELEGKLLIK